MDWHRFWVSTNKFDRNDWGFAEHELVMRSLEHAGSYDGLDVCNLAAFEDLVRQAQLIEYMYSQDENKKKDGKGQGKGKIGVSDEASIFAGTHREHGDSMVAPELLEYVSKEVEKDTSVLKQMRKDKEERRLAASSKTGG